MRKAIANWLNGLASRIAPKSESFPSSTSFVDAYRKQRMPGDTELLNELKLTAWTCATINAAVVADHQPKLYVKTTSSQKQPNVKTKALPNGHHLAIAHKGIAKVEEVTEHPILDLFKQVNPTHNAFDLWELTQLYLEVHGTSYWLLEFNSFTGAPDTIWILPTHQVRPDRSSNSTKVVDFYEFQGTKYPAEQIIRFAMPDARDPYCSGASPLKACYEQVRLTSEYMAMKRAIYDNTGIPSIVVSPQEAIGEDEKNRLEHDWSTKFRRGGQGKVLVTETATKIQILSHSLGDLAALSEIKASKEDIANAFHVPMPYLSGDTNLANMQAAEKFHSKLCIGPRVSRRDEKLNEQLIPLFDPTGRLFLETPDPVKSNKDDIYRQQIADIRAGIKTINEVRNERGLPPVPWGDQPTLGYSPKVTE